VYELYNTLFLNLEIGDPFIYHPTFYDAVDVRLSIWQHALFAVHKDILAVFLVLVDHERFGEPGIKEHPVPAVLAVGTVWVMDRTEEVRFGARHTVVEIAVSAINRFARAFIEVFTADCAAVTAHRIKVNIDIALMSLSYKIFTVNAPIHEVYNNILNPEKTTDWFPNCATYRPIF
jgi:hypothetical protein